MEISPEDSVLVKSSFVFLLKTICIINLCCANFITYKFYECQNGYIVSKGQRISDINMH